MLYGLSVLTGIQVKGPYTTRRSRDHLHRIRCIIDGSLIYLALLTNIESGNDLQSQIGKAGGSCKSCISSSCSFKLHAVGKRIFGPSFYSKSPPMKTNALGELDLTVCDVRY